jgi:hypothetical protein
MTSRAGRRQTDPELAPERAPQPVPVEAATLPVVLAVQPAKAEPLPDAAFEAQILGQPGVKRGLRGGQPVLDHARSAYLETEYSGLADRRPPSGVITKRDI